MDDQLSAAGLHLKKILGITIAASGKQIEAMWKTRPKKLRELCEIGYDGGSKSMAENNSDATANCVVYFYKEVVGEEVLRAVEQFPIFPKDCEDPARWKIIAVWPHEINASLLKFSEITPELVEHCTELWIANTNTYPWPAALKEEVQEAIYDLMFEMEVFQAKEQKRIILPVKRVLIQNLSINDASPSDVSSLASTAAKWISMIKLVCCQTAEPKSRLHPLGYLEFWRKRSSDLRDVLQQCHSVPVKNTITLLRVHESPYGTMFLEARKLLKQLEKEATQFSESLECLRKYLLLSNVNSLKDVAHYFPPILHILSLMWFSSDELTSTRLTTFISSFSTHFIVKACVQHLLKTDHCRYASKQAHAVSALWEEPPQQVVARLIEANQVFRLFRTMLFNYQTQVNSRSVSKMWHFDHESNALPNFDRHAERFQLLLTLFRDVTDCQFLHQHQICGFHGGDLTRDLQAMLLKLNEKIAEFRHECQTFFPTAAKDHLSENEEDIFDVSFHRLQEAHLSFEAKLYTVLDKAIEQCGNFFIGVRILLSLKPLQHRPKMKNFLAKHAPTFLAECNRDIDLVCKEFLLIKNQVDAWQLREDSATQTNLERQKDFVPCLTKLHAMQDRAATLVNTLKVIDVSLMSHSDADVVLAKRAALLESIDLVEKTLTTSWSVWASKTVLDSLEVPIFRLGLDNTQILVNLSQEFCLLLDQFPHLPGLNVELGGTAGQVLRRLGPEIKRAAAHLDISAQQYNKMTSKLTDGEKPLFQAKMEKVRSTIQDGLAKVTWRSSNLLQFTHAVYQVVSAVDGAINYVHGNHKCYQKILHHWKDNIKRIHAIDETLDDKKRAVLVDIVQMFQLDPTASTLSIQDRLAKKMIKKWRAKISYHLQSVGDVTRQYNRVRRLLDTTRDLVGLVPQSKDWQSYLRYVEVMFDQGITAAIRKTLEHLVLQLEEVRTKGTGSPPLSSTAGSPAHHFLMQVSLELFAGKEARFKPTIDRREVTSVQFRVYDWVHAIFSIAGRLPRFLDPTDNFGSSVSEHEIINALKDDVLRLMQYTIGHLESLKEEYSKFGFLWLDDPLASAKRFLSGEPLESNLLTEEEQEATTDFMRSASFSASPRQHIRKSKYDGGLWSVTDRILLCGGTTNSGEQQTTPSPGAQPKRKFRKPSLLEIDEEVTKYERMRDDVLEMPTSVSFGWLNVSCAPIRTALLQYIKKWRVCLTDHIIANMERKLSKVDRFIKDSLSLFDSTNANEHYDDLVKIMFQLTIFAEKQNKYDSMFDPMKGIIGMLERHDVNCPSALQKKLEKVIKDWREFKTRCQQLNIALKSIKSEEVKKIHLAEKKLHENISQFVTQRFPERAPLVNFSLGARTAYKKIFEIHLMLTDFDGQVHALHMKERLFGLSFYVSDELSACQRDVTLLKQIWDIGEVCNAHINSAKSVSIAKVDYDGLESHMKKLLLCAKALDARAKEWSIYQELEQMLKRYLTTIPLVQNLQLPCIREKHWRELLSVTGVSIEMDQTMTLDRFDALQLHKHVDAVTGLVEKAQRETQIEKQLDQLKEAWQHRTFKFTAPSQNTKISLLVIPEEMIEAIEEHQLILQQLSSTRFAADYMQQLQSYEGALSAVEVITSLLLETQKTWNYLMNIFIDSDDVQKQLPVQTQKFKELDSNIRAILRTIKSHTGSVLDYCYKCNLEGPLTQILQGLATCEKALEEYLEIKRVFFSRFYFISTPDLLDILSAGSHDPARTLAKHTPKLFPGVISLLFEATDNPRQPKIVAVKGVENERCDLSTSVSCEGKVECWIGDILTTLRSTVKQYMYKGISTFSETNRPKWAMSNLAQVAVFVSRVMWNTDVITAFRSLEEGNEMAMKELKVRCDAAVVEWIRLVQGDLIPSVRTKLMNLVTYEVHGRDVVEELVLQKVDNDSHFLWQQQLRQRYDELHQQALIEICDVTFEYGNEYLGNPLRLVLTPLTSRINITLTQALHLKLGGAPAGPAGTGKTETTKDLGAQIGKAVFVFNCSEQMNSLSLGATFKGVAATGVWGCFDEFNRIAAEVLSVLSMQYKTILDALRENRRTVTLVGAESKLDSTCGVFITMNPGYAGRTELPESLKALFRPVTVFAPDVWLICENMLMAEGFINARTLARKFISLFKLSSELLSKQIHYDWGLRAVKSLLVVAGRLRRENAKLPEEVVLMKALRDFNIPKIAVADVDVFRSLLIDLFPSVTIPKQQESQLEDAIRSVCSGNKLQAEENFLNKVTQLKEQLQVRHCVFLLGTAGCGKTSIWRTLSLALRKLSSDRVIVRDLNPKTVSSSELYGYVSPATKEWKDGLFTNMMRELSMNADDSSNSKWIVLDGELDTHWIESMNSVMDDNKILTLANNERILLQPSMRLLFEIHSLRYATPATVSRAGIVFLSPSEVSWLAIANSQLDTKSYFGVVGPFLEKYVPPLIEFVHTEVVMAVPFNISQTIQTLCCLCENLLAGMSNEKEMEHVFMFCCVWAFGGPLLPQEAVMQEQNTVQKMNFDKWWRKQFRTVKFPPSEYGLVFDFFYNHDARKFEKWTECKQAQALSASISEPWPALSQNIALQYLSNMYLESGLPVLFIGFGGCGKSTLSTLSLQRFPSSNYTIEKIFFNYETSSSSLQSFIEEQLERKHGRTYQPTGRKKLILVVEELTMPRVDIYGSQSPIALLRQLLDYSHFFDRSKWFLREITDISLSCTLNPSIGSLTVSAQLLRHFAVLSVSPPSKTSTKLILKSLMSPHIRAADLVISLIVDVHDFVLRSFTKSTTAFHYEFNLKQMLQTLHGVNRLEVESSRSPPNCLRVTIHELLHTYGDRLMSLNDTTRFHRGIDKVLNGLLINNNSQALGASDVLAEEEDMNILVFSSLSQESQNTGLTYKETNLKEVKEKLELSLKEFNELTPALSMDLALFEDACLHVVRLIRQFVTAEMGHSVLFVGVGGSGKQSLTKLAAHACGFNCTGQQVNSSTDLAAFRELLKHEMFRAGVKGEGRILLMNESQICDDLLSDINSFLLSGEVFQLHTKEEKEEIWRKLGPEVRSALIVDSKENIWRYFLGKVRRNFRIVLCCTPGDHLRTWCRKYSSFLACMHVNWFLNWPLSALESVCVKMLTATKASIRAAVTRFLTFAHVSSTEMSLQSSVVQTVPLHHTPKTFIDCIQMFQKLQKQRSEQLEAGQDRYKTGLRMLKQATRDTVDMQSILTTQRALAEEKREAAESLLYKLNADKEVVEEENNKAMQDETVAMEIQKEVTEQNKECEEDLAKAEPALHKAEAALDTLNKANMTELKSFKSPPAEVQEVLRCVLILLHPSGTPRDNTWPAAVRAMQRVDGFLASLKSFDKENVPEQAITNVKPYLANPNFNGDAIAVKSFAAAGLCEWVRNIVEFHRIYWIVKPKRDLAATTKKRLDEATAKLQRTKQYVEKLRNQLQSLQDQFEEAENERRKIIAEVERSEKRLSLALRLVKALDTENQRWADELELLKSQAEFLIGDSLLAAAFVTYAGGFNFTERTQLLSKWLEETKVLELALSAGGEDPINLLATSAQRASWHNEELPTDFVSVQNACILLAASRVSILVDPQLQGLRWVRCHFLKVLAPTEQATASPRQFVEVESGTEKMKRALKQGVVRGDVVVVLLSPEIGIDAFLAPLVERRVMNRFGRNIVALDEQEYDVHPQFLLILHSRFSSSTILGPEVQSTASVINFKVTPQGLEAQLLSLVLHHERADIELELSDAVRMINDCQVEMQCLEDRLINFLSTNNTEGLLEESVVEGTERLKFAATEVKQKIETLNESQKALRSSKEIYRSVAARGSKIFFMFNELHRLEPMYEISLAWFLETFEKAISGETSIEVPAKEASQASPDRIFHEMVDPGHQHIEALCRSVTYILFVSIRRGLFEKHKLSLAYGLSLALYEMKNAIPYTQLRLLLGPMSDAVSVGGGQMSNIECPPWMPVDRWKTVVAVSEVTESFEKFASDIDVASKRWKEWMVTETPESERMPGEWRSMGPIIHLIIVRILRPDRFVAMAKLFVAEVLGVEYLDALVPQLAEVLKETSNVIPLIYILFQGADPAKEVEAVGKKLGYSAQLGNFHSIAMGEGQEPCAEQALRHCSGRGGWVLLQNVHLMTKWLPKLDELLETELMLSLTAHRDFRLFLTAEPQVDPTKQLPSRLIQRSLKLVNEPPRSMKASLMRSFTSFSSDFLERSVKGNEFKTALFSLCFFHVAMVGRNAFGHRGWTKSYAFNASDLTISGNILFNYLETNAHFIPWQDIRTLIGEIMYGGHITDIWDRRVCKTYLECLLSDEILQEEAELAPGIAVPLPGQYSQYLQVIECFPTDNPQAFGLPVNAQLKQLGIQGGRLCDELRQLRANASSASSQKSHSDGTMGDSESQFKAGTSTSSQRGLFASSSDHRILEILEETLSRFPDCNPIAATIQSSYSVANPFLVLLSQEFSRVQTLVNVITESIGELQKVLKGKVSISDQTQELLHDLSEYRVPKVWLAHAPLTAALNSLRGFVDDIMERMNHIEAWSNEDSGLPKVVKIGALFNPVGLLTAVIQTTARKTNLPLDEIKVHSDVLKKLPSEVTSAPREGAYIYGLYLEGARWDAHLGVLMPQTLKDHVAMLPIIHVRAIAAEIRSKINSTSSQSHQQQLQWYECPVYTSPIRGQSFVFSIPLKTVEVPSKWVLAGVCALLSLDS